MVQIRVAHAEEIEKIFSKSEKEAKIVLWRAINRAAIAARTKASVEIRKNYIIKAVDVKKTIKIRTATANRISAEVRASGPVTPLMKFDVSSLKNKMVTARVKKGSKKPVQTGFIARMSNGHTNVVTRVGSSRYPIKGFYGPSVAQMMGNEEIADSILFRAQEVLDDRLEHELSRFLSGGL